jgi:hypothetical protein
VDLLVRFLWSTSVASRVYYQACFLGLLECVAFGAWEGAKMANYLINNFQRYQFCSEPSKVCARAWQLAWQRCRSGGISTLLPQSIWSTTICLIWTGLQALQL